MNAAMLKKYWAATFNPLLMRKKVWTGRVVRYSRGTPSAGSVYFGSQEIGGLSARELLKLRRNIGTVFQDFRLLPTKTVYENIAFALEVAGKSDEDIEADVPHVLELVGLLDKIWKFGQRTLRPKERMPFGWG